MRGVVYEPRSNTCELISCEQVLSRCNINELHSICSIACTAPVHLANRSLSLFMQPRSSRTLSFPPRPLPFSLLLSVRRRSDCPRLLITKLIDRPGNEMKPLAYCERPATIRQRRWDTLENSGQAWTRSSCAKDFPGNFHEDQSFFELRGLISDTRICWFRVEQSRTINDPISGEYKSFFALM